MDARIGGRKRGRKRRGKRRARRRKKLGAEKWASVRGALGDVKGVGRSREGARRRVVIVERVKRRIGRSGKLGRLRGGRGRAWAVIAVGVQGSGDGAEEKEVGGGGRRYMAWLTC